jgi:hypothetical protein
MAVALDVFTHAHDTAQNVSFTHTPVGTPSVVIIGAQYWDPTITVSSVTYGGDACTLLKDAQDAGMRIVLYYKNAPLSGARTVAINRSGANSSFTQSCTSFLLSDAVNPIATVPAADTGNKTPYSVAVSGKANGVYMAYHTAGILSPGLPTAGVGQVELENNAFNNHGTSSSYKSGTGLASTTMSYSYSEAYAATLIGLLVQPPSAPNQVIWFAFKHMQDFLRDLRTGLIPPNILKQRYGDLVAI